MESFGVSSDHCFFSCSPGESIDSSETLGVMPFDGVGSHPLFSEVPGNFAGPCENHIWERGARGSEAGKRVQGRKRHMIADRSGVIQENRGRSDFASALPLSGDGGG